MEMHHARSVRISDLPQLRAHLDHALEGVPEETRMQIARTATLSAQQALGVMEHAVSSQNDILPEQADHARDIIERFAVTP